MTKTYNVLCPDPECATVFTHEGDPAILKTEEGETITCLECGGEWDWTYDEDEDELVLLAADDDDDEDEFDEDEDEGLDADEEEEDDEE